MGYTWELFDTNNNRTVFVPDRGQSFTLYRVYDPHEGVLYRVCMDGVGFIPEPFWSPEDALVFLKERGVSSERLPATRWGCHFCDEVKPLTDNYCAYCGADLALFCEWLDSDTCERLVMKE